MVKKANAKKQKVYKYVVAIPVTEPPPGHRDNLLIRLEHEVHLRFGKDATVQHKKLAD